MNRVLNWFDVSPRHVLALVCACCIGMLAFGFYLQHVQGLEPCPMCVVQRYALVLIAICAGLTAAAAKRPLIIGGSSLMVILALAGAFVAARQSWLQWYPPEVASCGRDIYGMIENFPLQRVIPMLFRGSGDCSKIDWVFLGGTIANWAFLWFCAVALIGCVLVWRQSKTRA